MSHSRKKTPGFCDSNSWAKNYANRCLRRHKGEVGNGGWFKKMYEQYDICDWTDLYFYHSPIEKWVADDLEFQKKVNPLLHKSSYRYRLYMK